jgi:hypothetical protein
MVLLAHAADTPAGKFVGVPMPVAPVVVWVMSVNGVLIHSVGELDAAPTVLSGRTVIVLVTFIVPQEVPLTGMD